MHRSTRCWNKMVAGGTEREFDEGGCGFLQVLGQLVGARSADHVQGTAGGTTAGRGRGCREGAAARAAQDRSQGESFCCDLHR